jgi:hypothetical protein
MLPLLHAAYLKLLVFFFATKKTATPADPNKTHNHAISMTPKKKKKKILFPEL